MSKTFFKISFGLMAAACFLQAASAAVTAPVKQLSGHVPAVVSRLTSTGALPTTNTLHLSIGLPLRNPEGLDNLVSQINDPNSPNYHHYLSVSDFTDQFGPSQQDYQAAIDFAKASGFKITTTHANRMLVEFDGQVSDIQRAFNVKLQTYQHPTESRTFFAPNVEPSVPASLSAVEIGGLNNYSKPQPKVHFRNPTSKTAADVSAKYLNGSGAGGTYLGNDFRPAYVPGTTLTGAGQKVALFEYDGYLSNDITMYEQRSSLPAVSLTNVLLQGFSGTPYDPNAQGEVTLDIDMIIAMAPGVSQVIVYEGNLASSYQPNLVLNQIASDNLAHQVSSSWGWSGGPSVITDQIFKEMILQGQSFFNASGDKDAFLPPGASGQGSGSVDDPNSYNAPSDSPYITQVGATKLATTGPGGSYVREKVWNWGLEYAGYDGVGSSGGISGYYTIPSWQQGISMTSNGGSTTTRNTPDVALTGEDIDIFINGADAAGTSGTSCAAPLWAGFIALVNQQAAANNLSPVGFINPAIYALAKTTAYTNIFNDIASGNDTWSQSPNSFYAVPGYDLCAGLGTPNGTNLINALVKASSTNSGGGGGGTTVPVIISAPTPPWGSALSVMNGSNPNGAWFLFVQDDAQLNVGMINNGWSVSVVTGNPVGAPADNEIYAPANISLALNATTNIYLAITNYGPASATNVVITDSLPGSGLTLNSVTPTNNVTILGNTLTWKLGNLAVNAGGRISLNFSGTITGNYTNSPAITSTTIDPNPDDKFADTAFSVAQPLPPQLTAYTTANGHFVLTITNDANLTTVIQATTNLLSPTWVNIYTGTPPFTTNIDVLTNYPSRFYRAVIGGQ